MRLRILALALLITATLAAQSQVTLTAPGPANVANASATGGASGSNTYYYWVIAVYPIGKANPSPAALITARATPTAGVPITISWTPVSGATSYDVLKTTNSAVPTGTCTCGLATAQTGSSTSDTGGALSSYTLVTVGGGSATMTLDNQTGTAPFVNVAIVGTAARNLYKMAMISSTAVVGQAAVIQANGVLTSTAIASAQLHSITFVVDGAGVAIVTGDTKSYPTADFACTINRIDISADQSGSITVDVWKAAGAIPTSLNKISASAPLTLSSAQLAQNGSLTGWTTAVSVGDIFGFSVATASTVTRVIGQIWCQ